MPTSITSPAVTDGQKKQYDRFMTDAFADTRQLVDEKVIAHFDKDALQRFLARGDEFRTALFEAATIKAHELSLLMDYADEEVASTYVYPSGYSKALVKPIERQVDIIAKIFSLSLGYTSEWMEKVMPTLALPDWAEGWFATPSVDALAVRFFKDIKDPNARYCAAVNLILKKIGESRRFYNYRDGQITPDRYRMNARTAHAMDLIMEQQKGDILIIPGQFGLRHRGRSVRRARVVMTHPEFGHGAVAVGSMLLTHPERLVSYDDLWIDVPGDEFSPKADGQFSRAPCFYFYDGKVRFDTCDVDNPHKYYGSTSGAVPQ